MTNGNLLRVTRIRVEGLFDCYSHDVSLHLNERVTIIHGPNGVGKTVLLRLTAALISGRLTHFAEVPFHLFEIFLSDGSIFGVKKDRPTKPNKNDLSATFFLRSRDGALKEFSIKGEQTNILRLAQRIESESPWLTRYSATEYLDRRSNEMLSAIEVVSKYPEYLPGRLRRGLFEEPEWMRDLQNRIEVHLIEAQRLLRFAPIRDRDWEFQRHGMPGSEAQYVETVRDYARDLQKRISETLTIYAKNSQSLDQSFPERLLKGTEWGGLTLEDLKKRMQELEEKRQQLRRIGLIEQDASYPFDVSALENTDASQRSVMTLYVDDTAKKLGALDDLARRVQLMLANINKKFNNKAIRISKDKGLLAFTADQNELELSSLSSGEQHELVLLYDLLFRVKSNTLVLIDEPELSLHVTWQKSFLPDLLEIVSATKFDVLLATHSPFIVGDRNDLMTPLLVGNISAAEQ